MPRRTLAVAAAVAVAGTALVPLLADAASAALPAPTDYQVIVADAGQGNNAVYRTSPTGVVVDTGPDDNRNLDTVAASRDGGRYTFVRTDIVPGTSTTEQILVREADGTVARIVDKRTTLVGSPSFAFDANPQLSPDGSEVVWTQYVPNGTRIQRANVTSGAVATVPNGTNAEVFGYVTSTALIGLTYSDAEQENCTGVKTFPIVGGAPIPVGLLTCNDDNLTVSPSGAKLAWTRFAVDDGSAALMVADLAVVGDTATVSNVTERVSDGNYNVRPAWSSDGLTLSFIKGEAALSDIWTVPADGSASPTRQSTGNDEFSVATIVRDGTAPTTTVSTLPFLIAGDRSRLNWSLTGSDADLAGIRITRTGGTGTVVTRVTGAATTYVDTGLKIGTTYTYAIAAVDHSGNVGTAATRQLQAISPGGSTPDPSTGLSATETFPVFLPAVGTYSTRVRINGAAPITWIPADGPANHGSSHTYAGKRGNSYAFSVTVRDAYGNASAEAGAGSTVVPLDQTSATYQGNTAPQALSGQYLGSARVLRAAGAYGQVTVKGNRFQVVGDRCASCGIFDVYVNGVRVAGVDSRNAVRQARQVLFSRTLNPAISSTIVIKARGTAGRPNVVLDGFAVRR